MTKGVYNLEDGDNDFLNLNAEIEDKLNKQLKPYCYLRGGSSCEFTEAQKLKIKVSGMQLYGCPTTALDDASAPTDIIQYWGNFQNYMVDMLIMSNATPLPLLMQLQFLLLQLQLLL